MKGEINKEKWDELVEQTKKKIKEYMEWYEQLKLNAPKKEKKKQIYKKVEENKRKRKIVCTNLLTNQSVEYSSVIDCVNENGFIKSAVFRVLTNKQKHHRHYTFQYV